MFNIMKVLILNFLILKLSLCAGLNIEDIKYAYEDEKNMVLADEAKGKFKEHQDYYYESLYQDVDEEDVDIEQTMDIIFYGPTSSFLRLDVESLLHVIINVKKQKIPRSRVLLAWDMVTDGRTAEYLSGRELYVFCFLLNMVPEEDLHFINMGEPGVLAFFASNVCNLHRRKFGVLISAFRRYYGNTWYKNSSTIAELGYLICGVPASELAVINPSAIKALSSHHFMKIIQCNYLQKKALFDVATKNEAYGVPYTWTSSEVKNIGVLLACIPTNQIPTLSLQAVSAISPIVIKLMHRVKLNYFTNQQILSMSPKTRKVFVSRMHFTMLTLEKVTKALALSNV